MTGGLLFLRRLQFDVRRSLVVVRDAREEVVLVDDLVISGDILDDVLSASRLAGETDDFLTPLAFRLVQQPQGESSVSLTEIMPETPDP